MIKGKIIVFATEMFKDVIILCFKEYECVRNYISANFAQSFFSKFIDRRIQKN